MKIIIANRAYSSWSLRGWLAARQSGLPFTTQIVPMDTPEWKSGEAKTEMPSGKVPVLWDGKTPVWDSFAIILWLADKGGHDRYWPREAPARALAYAMTAEMHSGFQSLRGECPMALELEPRVTAISEATQKNVRRIVSLWSQLLRRSGGPFLAGEWSIADAFYTPVATRFRTYGVHLSDYGDDGVCGAYATRLLATPEFLEWEAAAKVST